MTRTGFALCSTLFCFVALCFRAAFPHLGLPGLRLIPILIFILPGLLPADFPYQPAFEHFGAFRIQFKDYIAFNLIDLLAFLANLFCRPGFLRKAVQSPGLECPFPVLRLGQLILSGLFEPLFFQPDFHPAHSRHIPAYLPYSRPGFFRVLRFHPPGRAMTA